MAAGADGRSLAGALGTAVARTSMRPMLTWMVGAGASRRAGKGSRSITVTRGCRIVETGSRFEG